MKRRGLDLPGLSQLTGLAHRSLEPILCGRRAQAATTRRIEFALDEAIWVPPAEFEFRRQVNAFFGLNIYTTPITKVRLAVRKSHGIIIHTGNLMRAPTEARLERHFMKANPTVKRQ